MFGRNQGEILDPLSAVQFVVYSPPHMESANEIKWLDIGAAWQRERHALQKSASENGERGREDDEVHQRKI